MQLSIILPITDRNILKVSNYFKDFILSSKYDDMELLLVYRPFDELFETSIKDFFSNSTNVRLLPYMDDTFDLIKGYSYGLSNAYGKHIIMGNIDAMIVNDGYSVLLDTILKCDADFVIGEIIDTKQEKNFMNSMLEEDKTVNLFCPNIILKKDLAEKCEAMLNNNIDSISLDDCKKMSKNYKYIDDIVCKIDNKESVYE